MNIALLVFYCFVLIGLSLLGGWLPTLWKWTHIRIQMVMSLIAGFMLGIAFVQLLPHSFQILNDATTVGMTMLGGLLTMFFMIRIFDFHHHHFPDADHSGQSDGCGHAHDHTHDHSHELEPKAKVVQLHKKSEAANSGVKEPDVTKAAPLTESGEVNTTLACARDHDHSTHDHLTQQSLAWMGLLLGLGLHSIMDGVALAASMKAEALGNDALLAGVGIFLAIALHKPLDSMSIASVMSVSKWDRTQQMWVNLVFALSCPLAALAVYFGIAWVPADTTVALGFALAFSAGTFLCISLGDLLPELHFHTHDRFKLSVALLVGIGLAIVFEFLPLHAH